MSLLKFSSLVSFYYLKLEGNILPYFETYSQIISISLTPLECEKIIILNKRLNSYILVKSSNRHMCFYQFSEKL